MTLRLHDMLEIKTILTLCQLRTILKGHFKDESTTDLYHRLIKGLLTKGVKTGNGDAKIAKRVIEVTNATTALSVGKVDTSQKGVEHSISLQIDQRRCTCPII
ncbi:hypothetical protein N1851_033788 [Merluccius polli]|uniref:Uncharacterized protein n=1 Tax=Merluccius polli TaxID=89951 RepID=A0AA47M0T5_MERPO|nr:hypothetical protein N1851_033788 [Merluccius polli]